jgi:uncharacterized protein with ParB-like and HNH nuclease domain
MKEIRGDAKSVRALLSGAKYAIDYYQRDYRWETKQVAELLDDLCEKFLETHKPEDERSAVEQYGHYFLGSVIISDKDGRKFIIDGQQRLTSLTLLLIFMYRELTDPEQKSQLSELIFSQRYGQRSFNLDVEERSRCMDALFSGEPFDESDQPESVVNILHRYQDITDEFPIELRGESLPYFADWLIENVHFVEITAFSDADAYTIFETMNDRGLSLTPADMLKGYLLANIGDTDKRNTSSLIWKRRVASLREIGKEEDSDAIKAWLRSQHAKTIRDRSRGAHPQDFDLLGTEFHRWVRDNEEQLGLHTTSDFTAFIDEDFTFYTSWYERVRRAAETLSEPLQHIYYNAQHNFTLQYPVLLSPLSRDDSEEVITRKLRVVSAFLDVLLTRRIWNFRAIDYSTMQYAMFLVMRDIRGKTVEELVSLLTDRLNSDKETFLTNERFYLHGTNGRQIHRLLARMTDFVETQSGQASRYPEYMRRRAQLGYEVEHIWANHPERHTDEFAHPQDFLQSRNLIGGLLLLPKRFNASYGDQTYEVKRDHYFGQNLLAQSLHERAYEHNPGFVRFVRESGLPFRPHSEFKKGDLEDRQELYRKLAEKIWDPSILQSEAMA